VLAPHGMAPQDIILINYLNKRPNIASPLTLARTHSLMASRLVTARATRLPLHVQDLVGALLIHASTLNYASPFFSPRAAVLSTPLEI
jgi:hypothetical protein